MQTTLDMKDTMVEGDNHSKVIDESKIYCS